MRMRRDESGGLERGGEMRWRSCRLPMPGEHNALNATAAAAMAIGQGVPVGGGGRGAGDVPERQAEAGGAGGGEWGDGDRGLCPSSDGDPGDAAGRSRAAYSGTEALGGAGAEVEYAAAECV